MFRMNAHELTHLQLTDGFHQRPVWTITTVRLVQQTVQNLRTGDTDVTPASANRTCNTRTTNNERGMMVPACGKIREKVQGGDANYRYVTHEGDLSRSSSV